MIPDPSPSRFPLFAGAAALALLLAGGVFWLGNRAGTSGASTGGIGTSLPPAPPQPPNREVVEWNRLQSAALDAISRLRATVDVARNVMQQRQWSQTIRMMDEALPLARDARSAADRLRGIAQGDVQRQTVQDYVAQIDALAGVANDMRAEAQRNITRDEEEQRRAADARRQREEDARRQREEDERRRDQARLEEERKVREQSVRPPPPLPPPPERTWTVHRRRWVEGDGYNQPPPAIRDFNACARLCVEDVRCRMFEHATDDRTKQLICNLYDHTRMHATPGNATVGIMR